MATQPSITPTEPVLVVGRTGKTGRRVAERLRARGRNVCIPTPRATPPFDWNDPATSPAALRGGEEEAQRAEEVIRASTAAWTIIRSSFFAQNCSSSSRSPGSGGASVLWQWITRRTATTSTQGGTK